MNIEPETLRVLIDAAQQHYDDLISFSASATGRFLVMARR